MKAIVQENYGSFDQLNYLDIEKPKPKKNEVLVKIHYSAINDYDLGMLYGTPFFYRLLFGILKPRHKTPGMELSGVIEELGTNATKFKIGDKVYGDISEHGFGSFAEYIAINEKALSIKAEHLSFEDAVSIPHASMLAMQAIIDLGKIQDKQKILINGAGGGFGSFCIQIAKLYNAEITGVDTGDKLKRMKALGCHHIIDYKQEDFTASEQHYDLILDAKTNRSPFRYLKVLKKDGSYVTVGGLLTRLFQSLLLSPLIKLFYKKSLKIVPLKANKDLAYIEKLISEGKIETVIDGPFSLEEVPKAMKYFADGLHSGKVVISVIEQ